METLTRPIFLLTDFGVRDHYAGQVRAVIASIAPDVPVHDLTHEIEPYAIDEGAWMLECALPVVPASAVVMAVVDPGVGTSRHAIALRSAERVFVGPDNGLLSPVLPEELRRDLPSGGGSVPVADSGVEVHELTGPQFHRAPVSSTFHGRDIFAPVAAHLAQGLDIRQLGPPLASVHALPSFCGGPHGWGCIEGYVVHVDRYGNLITTLRAPQLFPSCAIEVAGQVVDTRVRTFAEAPPGAPFCHVDSSGFIAIAINQGSAATILGVRRGDVVTVRSR